MKENEKMRRRIQRRAKFLLRSLEMHGPLQVVLIDAPDKKHSTHKVRIVQNQNPRWFRAFAERHYMRAYGRNIRARPDINRRSVIRSLERIAAGQPEHKNARNRGDGSVQQKLIEMIEGEIAARDERRNPTAGNQFRDFPF